MAHCAGWRNYVQSAKDLKNIAAPSHETDQNLLDIEWGINNACMLWHVRLSHVSLDF